MDENTRRLKSGAKRRTKLNDLSLADNQPSQSTQIQAIYCQTQQFLESFDSEIKKCKEYNEDKTQRKYEVMLFDLKKQNKTLSEKLNKELLMRCPTKSYMNQLIESIVTLRARVDELEKEVQSLRAQLNSKQQDLEKQRMGIIKHEQIIRSRIDRRPSKDQIENEQGLQLLIKTFMNQKSADNQRLRTPTSKFTVFLKQNMNKFRNISVLLHEIDNWVEGTSIENSVSIHGAWQPKYFISKTLAPGPLPLNQNRRLSVMSTLDPAKSRRRALRTEPGSSAHQQHKSSMNYQTKS